MNIFEQNYLCVECRRAFYHDEIVLEANCYCAYPPGIPHRGLCETCYPQHRRKYIGNPPTFINRPFRHTLQYYGTAILQKLLDQDYDAENDHQMFITMSQLTRLEHKNARKSAGYNESSYNPANEIK